MESTSSFRSAVFFLLLQVETTHNENNNKECMYDLPVEPSIIVKSWIDTSYIDKTRLHEILYVFLSMHKE